MSNISANEDGGTFRDKGNLLRYDEGVHTTKLQVDLQADIGTVLLLSFVNMLGLNALSGNTNDGVRDALNFSVQRNTGVWQDTDNKLRGGLGSVTGLEPFFLKSAIDVALGISMSNGGSLVDDILQMAKKG